MPPQKRDFELTKDSPGCESISEPYRSSKLNSDVATNSQYGISKTDGTETWNDFERLRLLYNPLTSREACYPQYNSEGKAHSQQGSPSYGLFASITSKSCINSVQNVDTSGLDGRDEIIKFRDEKSPEKDISSPPMNTSAASIGSKNCRAPALLLLDEDLWGKFHSQQNEMIITKSGRCLFPCLRFKAVNLDPEALYTIRLDFEMTDPRRFRFSNGEWTPIHQLSRIGDSSDEGIATSTILSRESYTHPSIWQTGCDWMKSPISFAKVKLSNNSSDLSTKRQKRESRRSDSNNESSHLFHVLSFHKYHPRVHLIQRSRHSNSVLSSKCFTFDRTSFIAVTHYQNYRVNDLKKGFNPHAKGFRNKTGRSQSGYKRLSQSRQNQNLSSSGSLKAPQAQKQPRRDPDSSECESDLSDGDDSDSEESDIDGECDETSKDALVVSKKITKASMKRIESSRRVSNRSRQSDKNSRSIITITIAKSSERTSVCNFTQQSSKTADASCEDANRNSSPPASRVAGPVACASRFRSVRSQGSKSTHFPLRQHEVASAKQSYRVEERSDWGSCPSLMADQFHHLQEIMANANPMHFDLVNNPSIPSEAMPFPLDMDTNLDSRHRDLSGLPTDMTGSMNEDLNHSNSSILPVVAPAQPAPISWYQQFLLWGQPSANIPMMQSDSTIINTSTQEYSDSTFQLSHQPVISKSTEQASISDRTFPLARECPQHQTARSMPSPLLLAPSADNKRWNIQKDMSLTESSLIGPRLAEFVPKDGPDNTSDDSHAEQATFVGTGTQILQVTIPESKTSMSTSSVISLSPFSAYSGQARLERALRENNCLKAFIRERYGREAEADANAVVAMQCYE
ncbi:hypothetical protein BGZ80_007520 [Entomortierella chlamydospora]|uniref:T-box domain-containing protein n=1 Tax=Entomortierella chlamydospora TaxID=101097 RepID=A0A9P6MZH2_9FUNG|nr:hypothetical protein BGZ79_010746 [Entomortierella chlamydospora]KAG0018133.1 hypothetical protein BGZ80_007520 [Entomortierella chlamydospora]